MLKSIFHNEDTILIEIHVLKHATSTFLRMEVFDCTNKYKHQMQRKIETIIARDFNILLSIQD